MKAFHLWSLAQFGIARIDKLENLKWLDSLLGKSIRIDKPINEDFPSMAMIWMVHAVDRIFVTNSSIRSADPLNFRYSISLAIDKT